jgi:lipoyl(octanoyl) transferase
MILRYSLLGRMGYREAVALQERLRQEVLAGGDERLLVVEHEPVVTLGRSAGHGDILDASGLERRGVALEPSSRGGQVTYHGPGQLVVYAVVRIQSIIAHVEALCGAAVEVAAGFGIDARYRRDCPGVWVPGKDGDKKLASVGVHVHKKVTMHGLALNVATALEPFQLIRACGADAPPTSLALESGRHPTVWEVAPQYVAAFAGILRREPLLSPPPLVE